MKYMYQAKFSVGGYEKNFADGWEATFGKKKAPEETPEKANEKEGDRDLVQVQLDLLRRDLDASRGHLAALEREMAALHERATIARATIAQMDGELFRLSVYAREHGIPIPDP